MIAHVVFELEVPEADQQNNEELILQAVNQLEEYAIEFATDQGVPASRVKVEHYSIPYLRLTKYRFSVEVTSEDYEKDPGSSSGRTPGSEPGN